MGAAAPNQGLDHVALRTHDLDATVRFCTEALGFRFDASGARLGQESTAASSWTRATNGCSNSSTRVPPRPAGSGRPFDTPPLPTDEERARAAALVHFALRTEDPDTLYRRAVDAGARSLTAPTEIETTGTMPMTLYVGFVYGPDGEGVEFVRRPHPKQG
ncbi:bleomycin resistance protein [Streptomyces spongiicola]|uniref:Bleomycin resistance protein n=1 Tax=Streptomyces spongiicola TaxID=1690221 RepID=A0ABM6V936_9ACTN|nr:VOC family protein [Streptomyces spongiicola]AWK10531.1 bleomycin resistance protein [Streptomyces spongiicola]